MNDIKEIVFTVCAAVAFCFTVSTIRSCTTEQKQIDLEMLKHQHTIERTHTDTIKVDTTKGQNP